MNSGPSSIFELQPGAFIAGRYEIQKRLGNGGMGIVFKALDKDLDDIVALKLLHPHLAQDETVYRRFRNEVLVARALTHPNIVRTHDMGRADEGVSYISMEYIGGKSLRELLQSEFDEHNRGFHLDYALEVLYAILTGVGYAHGKGIIHRDLKPANVLLSDTNEIKLADFGTARILGMDTSITRMGQVVGTPDYMSPEQIRGEELSPHCDIYSLGIIAYELVTAQRPFFAESPVAVAFKHLNEEIPEKELQAANVPSWYFNLITKATAKKKEDRFDSVSEMAQFLLEHCPEVMRRTGMFPVEGSNFATNAAREALKSEAGKPDMAGETLSSSLPRKFEMGDVQPTSSGGWTLSAEVPQEVLQQKPVETSEKGSVSQSKAPASAEGSSNYVGQEATRGKRGHATRNVGLLVLLLLLVVVSLRFIPALQSPVLEYTRGLDSQSPLRGVLITLLDLPLVGEGVAGTSDPQSEKALQSPLGDTPVDERDQLQNELLAFASDSGVAAETGAAVTSSPENTSALETPSSTQPSEPSEPSPTEASQSEKAAGAQLAAGQGASPVAAATSGSETVQDAGEGIQQPDPVSTPKVMVESNKPTAANFFVLTGSNEVTESAVRFSDISSLKWRANFQGMTAPESSDQKREVVAKTKINVFDPRSSQVVATQEAGSVRLSGSEVLVEGRFPEVARKLKDIGQYRFDLIYDGEVLGSKNLSFYKANVRLTQSPSFAAGNAGGRVAIVRGAQVVEPTRSPEPATGASAQGEINQGATATQEARVVAPKIPTRSATQSAGQSPTTSSTASATGAYQSSEPTGSRVFIQPRSGSRVADPYANTGGLPPARGMRPPASSAFGAAAGQGDSQFGVQQPGGVRESFSENAGVPEPTVERDSYSGTFNISVGTQPEQARALILNLQTSGVAISGRATIAGFDSFTVTGKILTRGIELNLANQQYTIRLSGSRRGNSLHGVYFFPSLDQRGRWQAQQTN